MKNLANCKPSEFLKQTNRIKKAVEKWLTDTDILNIRKNMPALETVGDNPTPEERRRVKEANDKKINEQMRANLSAMFDAVADAHPEETLEVLALVCFVEPEDVDKHTVAEYLEAIGELLSNDAVTGFFSSLARWGVKNTSTVSRA